MSLSIAALLWGVCACVCVGGCVGVWVCERAHVCVPCEQQSCCLCTLLVYPVLNVYWSEGYSAGCVLSLPSTVLDAGAVASAKTPRLTFWGNTGFDAGAVALARALHGLVLWGRRSPTCSLFVEETFLTRLNIVTTVLDSSHHPSTQCIFANMAGLAWTCSVVVSFVV